MTRTALFRFLPLVLAAVCILGSLSPAVAQKKKKETIPTSALTQVSAIEQSRTGGSIKEVLIKLQGEQTNLGVLTKVVGDYILFENEGETLMYPLSVLQVVKFLKAEEGEARKIEIRFLSRD